MKIGTKLVAVAASAAFAGIIGWNALAESPAHDTANTTLTHYSAGLAAPAFGGAMGAGMMGSGMMGGGMSGDPSGYLAAIKQNLGITARQEPAWDAYAKTVRDTVSSLWTTHYGVAMNAMHGGSSPQAVMTAMHDQQQQTFQTLRTAADKLVTTLNEAQKTKATDLLPGLASCGRGGMHTAMMGAGMMGSMGTMGGRGTTDYRNPPTQDEPYSGSGAPNTPAAPSGG